MFRHWLARDVTVVVTVKVAIVLVERFSSSDRNSGRGSTLRRWRCASLASRPALTRGASDDAFDLDVVELSRLQFALTALYHFLFVPLTLGLSVLLAIMETVYVMTGRAIWRDMTKFWGMLFGINFAMGVATGITMEFQFGTNWAYYSHYVGDVFGAPLAIEGLMAFFLEATFVGLFFFGWDRLSQGRRIWS